MSTSSTSRTRRLAAHALAAAAFSALAVGFTWPLAARLATHVPGGGAGDNLTFVWNFWWMRHALATGAPIFHTDAIFWPFGTSLLLNTHTALDAFAGATLLSRLSSVDAQNVVIIASIAANGFFTYVLAHDLTRSRVGALAAGALFACAPYFEAHLDGHFNLIAAWGLPLFAWLWLRALGRRRATSAFAAGAAATLVAYTDYYYALFASAFAVCVLAYRWIRVTWTGGEAKGPGGEGTRGPRDQGTRGPRDQGTRGPRDQGTRGPRDQGTRGPRDQGARGLGDRLLITAALALATVAIVIAITGGGAITIGHTRISATTGYNIRTMAWIVFAVWLWRRLRPSVRVLLVPRPRIARDARMLATAALVFVAGTLPLLLGGLSLWQHGDYVSQTYFWRSGPEGVDLATLVLGNPFHPIWGAAIQRLYATVGIDPIEGVTWLGVVPIVLLAATWRAWRDRPHARLWAVVAAVFFVWALGSDLRVLDARTGLYLPEVLLRFVPVAANARMPGRAIVLVYLSLAVLVAIALASLRDRRLRVLVAAVLLLEALPFRLPLFAIDRPHVYMSLASLPAGGVLEIPLGVRDGFGERGGFDSRVLYYQTIHGKPIVGGFVARMSPALSAAYRESPALNTLLALSAGDPVDERTRRRSRDALVSFFEHANVRYVVVDMHATRVPLHEFLASLPLVLIDSDEGHRLYRVVLPGSGV
jgi:hypothetical protein